MTSFVVYDVFTDSAFGGNQLAVIPDATSLKEAQLQKIAREFNFSETTFVYPPTDPAKTAKVRIFTPTMEVPFAGHPTIGTAIALRDLGHDGPMTLELGVGPIPCAFEGDSAAFTTTLPLELGVDVDPKVVARCLGIDAASITTANHAPVQASVGLMFTLVELASNDVLSQCAPITDAFRAAADAYPTDLDFAVFAYTREGNTINARMFAPLDNIPEDPATGSASAALAALLQDTLGTPLNLTIHQGVDMGRPSLIKATTEQDPFSITISGQAVRTMTGTLTL